MFGEISLNSLTPAQKPVEFIFNQAIFEKLVYIIVFRLGSISRNNKDADWQILPIKEE